MKRIVTSVLALLMVLAFANVAFAQANRPTPNTQAPGTQPPAAGQQPAAPATTPFTVTGISPATIVSSPSEFPANFTIGGTTLGNIDLSTVELSDGTTALAIKLAAQPKDKSVLATITIPANATGEYVFSVAGQPTNVKLVIKDQATAAAEKAEADRKRAEAAAKAAAARAAAEAAALKATVAALKTQVANLQTTVGTTTDGAGNKIAGLEAANRSLTERVLNLEATASAQAAMNVRFHDDISALRTVDARQESAIGAIGAVVVQGNKPAKGSLEALRAELVAKGYIVVANANNASTEKK